MLFDEIEIAVAELGRVLRPGAPFIALVGGGPTAEGRDAYHAYGEQRAKAGGRLQLGDRRASSEAGWRELFAAWSGVDDIAFERWSIDFSGSFDDVWQLLAATYGHPADDAAIRDALRAEFPGERVPCTFVTFLATVRR
jgi:SAM-dependent methyltransferase